MNALTENRQTAFRPLCEHNDGRIQPTLKSSNLPGCQNGVNIDCQPQKAWTSFDDIASFSR